MQAMQFGQINVTLGWIWMILGILSGSVIGMWSFDGPFKTPKGWESYASLSRRMVRLGHIAFFALPMISILYGFSIDQVALSDSMKQLGSYSFLGCMMALPTLLIIAGFHHPVKYLTPIPVTSGFLGLGIICWGHLQRIL